MPLETLGRFIFSIYDLVGVQDPEYFYTVLHPTFLFDADLYPAFRFDAGPDQTVCSIVV